MKRLGEMGPEEWAGAVGEPTHFDTHGGGVRHRSRPSGPIGPLARAYQARQSAIRRREAIRRRAEAFIGEVVAVYGDEDDGQMALHYADGRIVTLRSTGYDDVGIDWSER